MEQDKDVEKIVLHYSDGTTKEVIKGFIASMKIDETKQEAHLTFNMVHMNGAEMKYIVNGMVEFGLKAGFFNDSEESESEED